MAEYLLVTALFREGSSEDATLAMQWLADPRRQFAANAVKRSLAGRGVHLHAAPRRCASSSAWVHGSAPWRLQLAATCAAAMHCRPGGVYFRLHSGATLHSNPTGIR